MLRGIGGGGSGSGRRRSPQLKHGCLTCCRWCATAATTRTSAAPSPSRACCRPLAPGLGYDDLAVADGNLAAALHQRALSNDNVTERQQTFAALRAYCQRDTLATLELRKALAALA